jgi:hypothetical protein
MKEEFKLSYEIKNLFEVLYADTMGDVQGDVTIILKEFIKLIEEAIERRVKFHSTACIKENCSILEELKGDLIRIAGFKEQLNSQQENVSIRAFGIDDIRPADISSKKTEEEK